MIQWRSATVVIAIVTALVSAFAILTNLGVAATYWGFTPALVGVDLASPQALPWWVTPFSSALIHGGWMHLIINMVMLLIAGLQVERVVGAAGLVMAYVVGAAVAALAQYFAGPNSVIPMIGASGAISALFGLYSVFFGRPKQVTVNQKVNRWIHIGWLLAAWVVIQWMSAALMSGDGVLIATPAHIGGFIAGLLLHRPLLLWRYRHA